MNSITFKKTQGGVPKTLPGEDHISGLLMYIPDASLPVGFSNNKRIQAISTIEAAESLGIKNENDANWYVKRLHYHISEALRINPGISLYVGLFNEPGDAYDFKEVSEMQNFAEGSLRQIAVYAPKKNLGANEITALKGVADTLNNEFMPLSILYACNIADISDILSLPNLSSTDQSNISVIISQDGDAESIGAKLFEDKTENTKYSVSTIGLALGTLSLASVHESIAWVQKFPSGINTPAFANGQLIKETDRTVIENLDNSRYLFLIKHGGIAGSFWNDSHNLDVNTSDYAYIEAVRTMDKAIRGIRTYLLPYLSGPVYVDAETGKLSPDTVTFFEQLAGKQLEDMERAGELSGYSVEIDPDQNVLSTGTVEFIIKKVQVGVMRKINIKIGFTTKLS